MTQSALEPAPRSRPSAPAPPESGGNRQDRSGLFAIITGRSRTRLRSVAVPLLFALLALAFVWPSLWPGRALLPIDALFNYPPWRAHAAEFGIGVPHNSLIADAILQNYSWKRFAVESFRAGELPLWNPYLLGGQPFLAAGQNGALYPLGVLFYLLPLPQAYGWFIALHLWIGALGAYWFARTLRATRLGGLVAGLTFGFCGYLIVSFLWPMVVSTAVWLPALLAVIERQMQRGPRGGWRSIALGGTIVGLQFLAGHLEMSLYLLLTAGLYTGLRIGGRIGGQVIGRRGHSMEATAGGRRTTQMSDGQADSDASPGTPRWRGLTAKGIWPPILDGLIGLAMVLLGTALAAVLLVPFTEVIGSNVRSGWSDYEETLSYALPRERLLAYLVPDLFGNPADHSYVDVPSGEVRSVEHTRPKGELRTDTEWGGKNYVEGTLYVGVLPLVLAACAILARPRGGARVLALVGSIAILFAFGTPAYALLYYGVPGVNQLHTPFRWIYPLSLCIAVLAGLGASALARPFRPAASTTGQETRVSNGDAAALGRQPDAPGARSAPLNPFAGSFDAYDDGALVGWAARLGLLAAIAGSIALAVLLVVAVMPEAGVGLAARALRRWPHLRDGFGDAGMLFSYQWANLLRAAVLVGASGVVIWLGARRRLRFAGVLVVGVLVVDLFTFGLRFNTVADTRPLNFVPPSIAAIQADPSLFRIVTYGDDDTLPSNTNMLFGLQDVRGYDTIILREYVEYLESIEPQRGIPFSKVAKLFDQRSLSSPLLDLLNVKYVLTSKTVVQPYWTPLAESDGVRVYRNERAMPRAFTLDAVQPVNDRLTALAIIRGRSFDPRTLAVLESAAPGQPSAQAASQPSARTALQAASATTGHASATPAGQASPRPTFLAAEVVDYTNSRVTVRATAPNGGVLVLADVFFPGWTATVDGETRPVQRAYGLFRAVEVGPGEHLVTFAYRPLSFRVGLLVSALGGLCLMVVSGLSVRRPRPPTTATPTLSAAQRVFKNSAFPMATSLLNKAIDLGFALVMFRILGAEGVGAYTFAAVLATYFDTVIGYGLGTLITRDVARDHTQDGRYLGNSIALRLALWVGAATLTMALTGPLAPALGIKAPLGLAIWLLVLGLLPGIVSSGISALFMARERMDVPAGVTLAATISKVVLGLGVLLAGYGYVGLAAVSVVTNLLTLALLGGLYLAMVGVPRLSVDPSFVRILIVVSFPLMINGLLNQLFFKIDALLLKPLAGDLALGWYSTAYKLIDGLQVIPASFVLAVFPLLSRHAQADPKALARITATALKLLLVLAFPIAVGTTILAEWVIVVIAGSDYLPQSATALRVLIWYLPVSFANGLLQYVLIARNRQRTLTAAFAIGVGFNLGANLLLIPTYGYLAAAAVTVASEIVLLVPFWWIARRELTMLPLVDVAWRPALAALVMAIPTWLVAQWSAAATILVAMLTYAIAALALGVFDADERRTLLGLLRRR
ncbi:MAG: oligosaccharide flippase family protein [Chloroflexi bacterium]|nr:oligosaccharide flippase family protein [Chloroflexota bacterium]